MAVWFCGGQIVVSASRSSPVCSNCSIHSSIASRPLEMNAAPVNARNTVCTVYAVSDVFLHRKDICVPLPCVTRRVNLDGIVCFLPYRTSEPIPLHAIAGLVQPSQLQEVIVLKYSKHIEDTHLYFFRIATWFLLVQNACDDQTKH